MGVVGDDAGRHAHPRRGARATGVDTDRVRVAPSPPASRWSRLTPDGERVFLGGSPRRERPLRARGRGRPRSWRRAPGCTRPARGPASSMAARAVAAAGAGVPRLLAAAHDRAVARRSRPCSTSRSCPARGSAATTRPTWPGEAVRRRRRHRPSSPAAPTAAWPRTGTLTSSRAHPVRSSTRSAPDDALIAAAIAARLDGAAGPRSSAARARPQRRAQPRRADHPSCLAAQDEQ